MTEKTPLAPVSKKGALRKRANEYMLEADARGALQVTIGRAADFFGPDTPQSILGEHFFTRVLRGKSAQVFGDPDRLHTYSYTPDVAAALVELGAREDARGVWMLPVQPAETTRAVIDRFARAAGQAISVSSVPNWMLCAVGVFQPTMRELAEMTYQWRQPYVIDDAKFRGAFVTRPTPWDEAIAKTLAWGRATYGSPARAAA